MQNFRLDINTLSGKNCARYSTFLPPPRRLLNLFLGQLFARPRECIGKRWPEKGVGEPGAMRAREIDLITLGE